MSWNSEVISAKGKYLSLSNMDHDADLTSYNRFSFSLVMLGTTMRQMAGYTGKYLFKNTYTDILVNTGYYGE